MTTDVDIGTKRDVGIDKGKAKKRVLPERDEKKQKKKEKRKRKKKEKV